MQTGAHNKKERLTTETPLVQQHLVLDHIRKVGHHNCGHTLKGYNFIHELVRPIFKCYVRACVLS